MDDGADLSQLLEAMRLFMPESTIRLILRLLTAILHIGTIPVHDGGGTHGDEAEIDDAHLEVPLSVPVPFSPPHAFCVPICVVLCVPFCVPLQVPAALLGVDPDSMRFALTNRQVQTGNRASIAVKRLDVDASTIVRDTLAKSLYAGATKRRRMGGPPCAMRPNGYSSFCLKNGVVG